MGTANAEEARPPSVQENANISSECLVTDKAVQLLPDFLSLLLWKFFCNPRTSQPFFSETRNNNRQIVFWEKHFQFNLQMRYLHNSTFNSTYVIKRHSVTSLVMLLKFIKKVTLHTGLQMRKRKFFSIIKVHAPL